MHVFHWTNSENLMSVLCPPTNQRQSTLAEMGSGEKGCSGEPQCVQSELWFQEGVSVMSSVKAGDVGERVQSCRFAFYQRRALCHPHSVGV